MFDGYRQIAKWRKCRLHSRLYHRYEQIARIQRIDTGSFLQICRKLGLTDSYMYREKFYSVMPPITYSKIIGVGKGSANKFAKIFLFK